MVIVSSVATVVPWAVASCFQRTAAETDFNKVQSCRAWYENVQIPNEKSLIILKSHFYQHFLFNIVIEVLIHALRQEKKNKKHTYWKGRNKTVCIYRWHGCLCRKSQVISMELQQMSGFSKFDDKDKHTKLIAIY